MTDEYDPLAPHVKQRVHDYLRVAREQCPVHHHVLADFDVDRINANPLVARPTSEFWSVLRYADCAAILQDPEQFSSREGPGPERLQPLNEEGMLLFADDPAHMRQRRIVSRAFTPRMVDTMRPRIQRVVDDLIDLVASAGRAEIMTDFSVPLTITMIAQILGVGQDRADDVRRWGDDTIAAFGGDSAAIDRSVVSMTEMFACFQEQIDARRAADAAGDDLPDDVMTALLLTESDGKRFDDGEVLMACQQLLTAGYETTSTAIASAVHLLCAHPDQRALISAQPDLLDNALEEVLRLEPPIEGLFRTTTRAVDLHDVALPVGAKVRVVFASANRDADQFPDADRFLVERDPVAVRRHLAFGFGPHACLGAALARTELRIAVETLFRRLPGLALDPDRASHRNESLLVNGFRELYITWEPAAVCSRERGAPGIAVEGVPGA